MYYASTTIQIRADLDSSPIGGSATVIPLTIAPAAVSPASSRLKAKGADVAVGTATAGVSNFFTVVTEDVFDNQLVAASTTPVVAGTLTTENQGSFLSTVSVAYDNGSPGEYIVSFTSTHARAYTADVTISGTRITGMPRDDVWVQPNSLSNTGSQVLSAAGATISNFPQAIAGIEQSFMIKARDQYGNDRSQAAYRRCQGNPTPASCDAPDDTTQFTVTYAKSGGNNIAVSDITRTGVTNECKFCPRCAHEEEQSGGRARLPLSSFRAQRYDAMWCNAVQCSAM